MLRPTPAPDLDTDVAIIGAGPAGLLIAELLADAGVRCIVLEAGPFMRRSAALQRAAMSREHPDATAWESRLTGVTEAAAAMPGAWPRVRAVGGRSLLWSGCCARFTEASFADARAAGAPWPVGPSELAPFYRIAERRFGVSKGRARLTAIERALGIAVEPRQTALLAGRVRTALSMARGKRRVVAEAIVRRILWDEQGATRGVEFSDARGRTRHARARVVVLCASPVESVRLVLTDPTRAIADRAPLIGRGLVDHLFAAVVAIAPVPVKRGSRVAGDSATFIPRFVNLAKASRRAYLGGFSMEASGPIAATHLDPAWIPMLGMSPRDVRTSSFYSVGALGDALPHPDRFVELHPRDKDGLGRPVPVVHQAWSDGDRRMSEDMMDSALAAIDAISPAGSVIVPFRDPRRHRGLFHEAGGLTMGADPNTSVTDPWGRIRGVRGLYVADASTFPTGGDRHPTLTILALAARTAHHIIESSRRGEP